MRLEVRTRNGELPRTGTDGSRGLLRTRRRRLAGETSCLGTGAEAEPNARDDAVDRVISHLTDTHASIASRLHVKTRYLTVIPYECRGLGRS